MAETIRNFTDLITWQEGHKLVLEIYKLTKQFPSDERFGLVSQLRRASVSVTSNIAEGFSRISYKEKIQFYAIALGSLTELQNQIIIAKDLKYFSASEFQKMNDHIVLINKMINGLMKSSPHFRHT